VPCLQEVDLEEDGRPEGRVGDTLGPGGFVFVAFYQRVYVRFLCGMSNYVSE
jgi:hypothetical protein